MEDTEMTLAQVREWAKQLHSEGKELKLVWDGGGDSGWVHFQIDGKEANGPEIDYLVDRCYEILDYGSWAGEFYASGESVYDPIEEAFVGEDNYSYDDNVSVDEKYAMKLTFPSSFKFDAIEIETETDDDSVIAHVSFRLAHGFFPQNIGEIEQHVAEQIEEQYHKVVNAYCRQGGEYRAAYNTDSIDKADMVLSECGTYYTATWKDFDITEETGEDKPIVLSLAEEEDE